MRGMIVGDVHGDFGQLNWLINRHHPDILIACGDFGYWPGHKEYSFKRIKPQSTKIYWCDGNHENHEALEEKVNFGRSLEFVPNVFYQPRGSIRIFPTLGTTLFMGGAYSIDKHWRTPGYDWFPGEEITQKDLDNLPDCRVDTVISHTGPLQILRRNFKTYDYRDEKLHDPSATALDYVLDKYQPSYWYFGHWHLYGKGEYNNTQWMALSHFQGSSICWTKIGEWKNED